MIVSTAEAKNRLPQLIRAVAQLNLPPVEPRKPRLGGMKGRITLLPGWDDPIDEDRFLAGDL